MRRNRYVAGGIVHKKGYIPWEKVNNKVNNGSEGFDVESYPSIVGFHPKRSVCLFSTKDAKVLSDAIRRGEELNSDQEHTIISMSRQCLELLYSSGQKCILTGETANNMNTIVDFVIKNNLL